MINEYFTVQHSPFFVSDQRAMLVICKEFSIPNVSVLSNTEDAHRIEQHTIAAYVLRLYTGLSLKQVAIVLNIGYGTLSHRLSDLDKKLRKQKGCNAMKSINNIINNL